MPVEVRLSQFFKVETVAPRALGRPRILSPQEELGVTQVHRLARCLLEEKVVYYCIEIERNVMQKHELSWSARVKFGALPSALHAVS